MYAFGFSINTLTLLCAGARHRPRRRRRHRHAREHLSPRRGGHDPGEGSAHRQPRDQLRHRRHDHHARGGVCPDRFHDGHHRAPVHGVRLDPCRCGDRVRFRGAQPVADDVLEASQAPEPPQLRLPRHRAFPGLGDPVLSRVAQRCARGPPARSSDRARGGELELFPVHHAQERARARGGRGAHQRELPGAGRRHHRIHGFLCEAARGHCACGARGGPGVRRGGQPDRVAGPRHPPREAVVRAHADPAGDRPLDRAQGLGRHRCRGLSQQLTAARAELAVEADQLRDRDGAAL